MLYSEFKKEMFELALKEIRQREKLSTKEAETRALAITIAAIKYQMLKQDVSKNLIFNKEEALKFEGNTGPYLLYTYARAYSILKKARYKRKQKIKIPDLEDSEKMLLTKLNSFPEIVAKAYEALAPNLIANYAHQIAQSFNEFYHSNKVIGSEKEEFRLVLVDSFSQVLKNSLELLGINAIERM